MKINTKRKKIKLYVYPHAHSHAHDEDPTRDAPERYIYRDTVPFSKLGIGRHCELVKPGEAEYFYMGQISDGVPTPAKESFTYLQDNEKRHICDIEGDWLARTIPKWLEECTLTMNGVRKEYVERNISIFVRPTFTFLLMDIIKNNKQIKHTFNGNKVFGFKGHPDPLGVRYKMLKAFEIKKQKLNFDITFNNKWQARALPQSKIVSSYCKGLLNNTFSLCPRGTGVDTVRFFESCFFSRVPVVISDCQVYGHDFHLSNPFYFQISPNDSIEEMSNKFIKIQDTPIAELKKMSYNAKKYFETRVRHYFEDPTLNCIQWLKGEKHGI